MTSETKSDVVQDKFLNQISALLKVFFGACYPGNELPEGHEFDRLVASIMSTFLPLEKCVADHRGQLPSLFDQSVDLEEASPAIQDFAFHVRRVVRSLSAFQVLCLLDLLLDYLEGIRTYTDLSGSTWRLSVSPKKLCHAFGGEFSEETENWAKKLIIHVLITLPAIESSRSSARAGREIANTPCTSNFMNAFKGPPEEETDD